MSLADSRTPVLEALKEALGGRGALLVGAPKIGKTRLLRALVKSTEGGTTRALRVDLRSVCDLAGTTQRFQQDLERAGLLKDLSGLVDSYINKKFGQQSSPEPWILIEGMLRASLPKKGELWLLLDGVTLWLDTLPAADAQVALGRLCAIHEREDRLGLVLTGEPGLRSVAARVGALADIAALPAIEIEALTRAETQSAFEQIGLDAWTATKAAYDRLWMRTRGHPHWVEMIARSIEGRDPVDAEDVEGAVSRLLSLHNRHLLGHHRSHLTRLHGQARAKALGALLSQVADYAEIGMTPEDAIEAAAKVAADPETLLMSLEEDFYLCRRQGRYAFVNPMLAEWWQRYGRLT